ncbi:MAG: hypothetical protein PUC18_13280 [Prevotellaceae bacterium]|nr:hypothetical protein [Prevotellaceae bacterium]
MGYRQKAKDKRLKPLDLDHWTYLPSTGTGYKDDNALGAGCGEPTLSLKPRVIPRGFR